MLNFYLIKKYIKYQITSNYAGGHGIHSPFVYDFVANILENQKQYYSFFEINELRNLYLQSKETTANLNFGAGSKAIASESRKISDISKNSSVSTKYGELLFRMVEYFKPQITIELGTSLGISTAYLATPISTNQIISIEANTDLIRRAETNLMELKIENIKFINSKFDDILPNLLADLKYVDFAFIDGNHKYAPTITYFNLLLDYSKDGTILIFDDIYWSDEMTNAWKTIVSDTRIALTIDLFQFGLAFIKKNYIKQHYMIRF